MNVLQRMDRYRKEVIQVSTKNDIKVQFIFMIVVKYMFNAMVLNK